MLLKSVCDLIKRFFNELIALTFSRCINPAIEIQKEIETSNETEKNRVQIKFKISKFTKENNGLATFINISIPFQFIKLFEPYRHIISHPKIIGRRICDWDVCEGETLLVFSTEETNFVIENVIKEIENAIGWIRDGDEHPIYCTEKTIIFEWGSKEMKNRSDTYA